MQLNISNERENKIDRMPVALECLLCAVAAATVGAVSAVAVLVWAASVVAVSVLVRYQITSTNQHLISMGTSHGVCGVQRVLVVTRKFQRIFLVLVSVGICSI